MSCALPWSEICATGARHDRWPVFFASPQALSSSSSRPRLSRWGRTCALSSTAPASPTATNRTSMPCYPTLTLSIRRGCRRSGSPPRKSTRPRVGNMSSTEMPCGTSANPPSCFTHSRASTRLLPRSTPILAPPISGRRTTASLSGWLSWTTCWEIASRFHSHESQPSIVGHPASLPLQSRPGQFVHPLLDLRAAVGRHGRQQVAAEHAQPVGDAVRAVVQWRGPVEQLHEPHFQAGPLQERGVLPDTREVPRVA